MGSPRTDRPLRILHLTSGNLYGGVETLLVELARRGVAAGLRNEVALTHVGRLAGELRATGTPVHLLGEVRMRSPVRVHLARVNLARLLSSEPFDLAVSHSAWAHALFAGTVRRSDVPLLFYLHGDVSGRHWLEWLARRTPPDLVVTNSHYTGGTSHRLFPGVSWEIVRPPVAHLAVEDPGTRARIRAELSTAMDDVVLVQSSRLEAWKGHRLHLEAVAKLAGQPGWTSWILGGVQRHSEADYLNVLKRMAVELGVADRVRFVGERSDIPAILSAADIHFQPNSSPEPFGIAFVEALYAGLPVVTTDHGGAREIVDPTCGVLVPPARPNQLADALRNLLAAPHHRRALGAAGPARAAYLCDADTQVALLGQAFARIAGRPLDGRPRRAPAVGR